MKNGTVALILWAVTATLWGVWMMCEAWTKHEGPDPAPVVVRDTVVTLRVDTVREVVTRVVKEQVVAFDTVYMDRPGFEPGFEPVARLQREFAGDNYRAWVSGADVGAGPWLDSVDVARDVVETIITERVEVPARRKRWGLGAQIGATWDYKTGRPAPYVGVGISYNFVTW